MGTGWQEVTARALAIVWAGFWTWFGLASGISEGQRPLGVLLHTMVPGGLFLISALIAWRWSFAGGVLLLLEGLATLVAYPLMTQGRFPVQTIAFVLATMALPPLIAGVLLLVGGQRAPA
jgi:hypothetical protein